MAFVQDTSNRTSQILLASDMIKAGFINSIIQLEAGVGLRKITSQRAALSADGRAPSFDKRQHMRLATSIVRPQDDFMHASNMMLLYISSCGDAAKSSIVLAELVQAHQISLTAFLESNPGATEDQFLDINSAYSLAKEFRDGGAYFQKCPDCGAGSYIIMDNPSQDRCAFCRSPELKKGHIFWSSID